MGNGNQNMKNKLIKYSVFIPIALSLFFAVTAEASVNIYHYNNYSGNEASYDATTTPIGNVSNSMVITAGQTYYFVCSNPTIVNDNGTTTYPAKENSIGIYYPLVTSTKPMYSFTPNDTTGFTTSTSLYFYTSNGFNFINCHNEGGYLYLSDTGYLYGPPNPFSTSTQPDFYHFPTTTLDATSTFFYVDCSAYDNVPLFSSGTIAGIGCQAQKVGMNIIGFLVTPPQWVANYLNAGVSSIKNAFPFNMVFGVVDTITNSTASSSAIYGDLTLTFPSSTYMSAVNVTPLSATFLKDTLTNPKCDSTCAENKKNDIFQFISAIVFVALGIKLITLIT